MVEVRQARRARAHTGERRDEDRGGEDGQVGEGVGADDLVADAEGSEHRTPFLDHFLDVCRAGVRRFFAWLETKAYKMHIRVLLSKYRSYTPCGICGGARLKTQSLLWRIGSKEDADAVLAPEKLRNYIF